MRAICRRSIDNSNSIVRDETHSFPRRIVRKAQHDKVRLVNHLSSSVRVLSPGRIDRNKLNIGPSCQALANLQASRSSFAVDEYFGSHDNGSPCA
jgi:hypothetical protein